METRTIIIFLILIISINCFAQNKAYANINFGHAPDCRGNSGACTFQTLQQKNESNRELTYDSKTHELILIFKQDELSLENKTKLLHQELEQDLFLFKIDNDFDLTNDLKNRLNIEQKYYLVKQGYYLVKVKDNQIIMKLKLE